MTPEPITPTPRLTDHARERCAEMGISTKVAKVIFRRAVVRRPGNPDSDCMVAVSDTYPDYAVVYFEADNGPVIATVLYRDPEVTSRPEAVA